MHLPTASKRGSAVDLMDGAEADVLAYMRFPSEASIIRLVGALLLEQSDVWQMQRRNMSLEALQSLSDNHPAQPAAVVG